MDNSGLKYIDINGVWSVILSCLLDPVMNRVGVIFDFMCTTKKLQTDLK